MTDSLERAIEAIDQQMASMAPAESAGRSHIKRQRLQDWTAQQIHRTGGTVNDTTTITVWWCLQHQSGKKSATGVLCDYWMARHCDSDSIGECRIVKGTLSYGG